MPWGFDTDTDIDTDTDVTSRRFTSRSGGERSPGWLAQPGVSLHDFSCEFLLSEQLRECKPHCPKPAVQSVGFLRMNAKEDITDTFQSDELECSLHLPPAFASQGVLSPPGFVQSDQQGHQQAHQHRPVVQFHQ